MAGNKNNIEIKITEGQRVSDKNNPEEKKVKRTIEQIDKTVQKIEEKVDVIKRESAIPPSDSSREERGHNGDETFSSLMQQGNEAYKRLQELNSQLESQEKIISERRKKISSERKNIEYRFKSKKDIVSGESSRVRGMGQYLEAVARSRGAGVDATSLTKEARAAMKKLQELGVREDQLFSDFERVAEWSRDPLGFIKTVLPDYLKSVQEAQGDISVAEKEVEKIKNEIRRTTERREKVLARLKATKSQRVTTPSSIIATPKNRRATREDIRREKALRYREEQDRKAIQEEREQEEQWKENLANSGTDAGTAANMAARRAYQRTKNLSKEERERADRTKAVIPLPVKLNKDWDAKAKKFRHDYEYVGDTEEESKALEQRYGRIYSVTNLVSALTGEMDEDVDKKLEELQKRAKAGYAKTEDGKSVNAEIKRLQNIQNASRYGTVFHSFVEELGKNGGSIDQATVFNRLVKMAEEERSKDIPYDKRVTSLFFDEQGRPNERQIGTLIRSLNQYGEWANSQGLGNLIGSEVPIAASFMTSQGRKTIAGTLDQLYAAAEGGGYSLADIKTTGKVEGKTQIQLALLSKILEAIGIPINRMGVVHSSKRNDNATEFHDFQNMTDEQLMRLIEEGIGIRDGNYSEDQIKEIQKRVKEFVSGAYASTFRTRKKKISTENELGTIEREITEFLFNGRTINDIYKASYLSEDEKVQEFADLYKTLPPEGKRVLMGLLYSDKAYDAMGKPVETNGFYRSGALWDKIRAALPTEMRDAISGTMSRNSGFSWEGFATEDEQGNKSYFGGTKMGGLYASEWSKAIRQAGTMAINEAMKKKGSELTKEEESAAREKGMRQAAEGMLKIIEEKLSVVENGKASSWADIENYQNAFSFLGRMLRQGEFKDIDAPVSSLLNKIIGEVESYGGGTFPSVAAAYQDLYVGDIGGGAQATSKELQNILSKNKIKSNFGQGVLAERIESFFGEGASSGGNRFNFLSFLSDLESLNQEEINGENAKKQITSVFSIIRSFGEEYRRAFYAMGQEGEIDENRIPEFFDNSMEILDIVSSFAKRAQEAIKKSNLGKETKDLLNKKLNEAVGLDEKGGQEIYKQISYRFTRMLTATDFYNESYKDAFGQTNKELESRGMKKLSMLEFLQRALTPEQWQQYQDSVRLKTEWEKFQYSKDSGGYLDFDDFIKRNFLSISPSQTMSMEMASLAKQMQAANAMSPVPLGSQMIDIVLPRVTDKEGNYSTDASFLTFNQQGRKASLLGGDPLDNLNYQRGEEREQRESLSRIEGAQNLIKEIGTVAELKESLRRQYDKLEEKIKEQEALIKRLKEALREDYDRKDSKNAEKDEKKLDAAISRLERSKEELSEVAGKRGEIERLSGLDKTLAFVKKGIVEKEGLDEKQVKQRDEDYKKFEDLLVKRANLKEEAKRYRKNEGSVYQEWHEAGGKKGTGYGSQASYAKARYNAVNAEIEEIEKSIRETTDVLGTGGYGKEYNQNFVERVKLGYKTGLYSAPIMGREKIQEELETNKIIEKVLSSESEKAQKEREEYLKLEEEKKKKEEEELRRKQESGSKEQEEPSSPGPEPSSTPPSKPTFALVSSERRKKPSVPREWDFDETRGDFFYKKKDGSFGGQKVSRKLLSEDQLGRVGKIAPPAGGSGGGTGGTISGGNVTISGGNITVKGSPVKVYGKPVEVRNSTETNVDAKGDTTINVSGPVTMNDAGGGSPTTISLTGNVQILGFSAEVTEGEGKRSSGRSRRKEGASAEGSSDVTTDDSSASTTTPDTSTSGKEGEKNNSISSIGRLIRELDQLERSIQKFNFRIDNAEGRGTDEDQEIADRLKGARADLEARRDAVMAEYEAEYSGLTTEAQGKADKLLTDSKARRDASAESVRLTESTKAEEDQLKRYERLLQERLQIEQKITSNLQKRATSQNRNEIEHLDNALSLERQRLATLTAEGDQIRKNLKASGRGAAVDAADMAYAERSEMLKAETSTNMHGARNIWDILGYDIQRSFNMIFDYGLAYRAISGIRMAFQGVLQDINEFDKAITNLRIVTGDTKEETEDLMRSYNKMADQLGVTTSAIADASNEWLRQGYSINETNDLIEASIQLSKLGGTTAADATEKLTAVLKGFKMEASEVSDIVDKLVSLDMDFATTASNIGEALSRVSAVARQAGMDLNETAAAVTVVMDATQSDAGSVGTAFRTIMTRYMNVKAGQFTDLETGEADKALNDTEKVLKTLGISIRDSKMEFRDFSDVLDELADKWVTLSSVEKSAIAVSLAGTRQQNMFFNLMDNYDKYQEAIETSADSAGTAEEKYEAYSESIEYQVERLTAAWEGFAQKLKANPVIIWLTEQAANLVEYLPNVIRFFVTLFTTLNAYKIPTALQNFFGMFTAPTKYGGKGTASIFTNAGQAQRAAKKQGEWNQQHGIASDANRPFQTLENVNIQGNKISEEGNRKLGFIQSIVAKIANKFGVQTTAGEAMSGAGGSGNSSQSKAPGGAASVAASIPVAQNQKRANAYAWSLARGTGAGTPNLKSKFGMSFFGPDALLSGISQEESQKIKNALEYYRTGKVSDPNFNNVTDVHMTKSGKWSFKDASGKRRYSTKKPTTAEDYYSPYLDVFAGQDQENINRGRLIYKGQGYEYDKKSGNFFAYERDKKGRKYRIYRPVDDETRAALTQAKINKSAITKQKVVGGAAAGLMAGLSTAMTTEGSAGDKAIAGLITGGLSAAGMAIGGPIGGMIGQVIGDIIGPLILDWIHADEIARKERVENSKAYLEALQGLSSTMEKVGDNITKGLENWTAEDYEAQQEHVKEIKSTLYAFDDSSTENVNEAANAKELREAFAEELQKLPVEIQKLIVGDSDEVSSSYADISSALDILASGGEGAEEINAALMAAQYRQQAQALWGSQEEERYQAIQQMSDNFAGYSLLSNLERLKDTEEYAAATEEDRQNLERMQFVNEYLYGDTVEAYESAQAILDQLDKEVSQNNMMSAFYSSGVSQMSSLDIGEASLEGTRLKILKDWAEIDKSIVNQDGTFTQDAIDMVNDFLRTQENFSSLFDSSNLTFGEVFDVNNETKRDSVVAALQEAGVKGVYDFQDVLNLASKNTEESAEAMKIAAKTLGVGVDKVVDDLFNLEASNRQSFAAAFGTSTQFIEENLGALQNLKLEDIINGLDGLNSRYEDIASIFDDIASDLTLTQESLDTIMENYSFLMYGTDEEGNVTYSQSNVLPNIVDMVVGKDSEASLAYASAILNDANNSTAAFEVLRKQYGNNWSQLFGENLTEEELQILNSEDTTMESVMSSSLFQKMGDDVYSAWGKIVSQMVGESEYMTMLQEAVYEYGSHLAQKEIDNLESIKDNLDAINETRQKELDLIKAKDKLENAKDEKQLVYRAGIGWAYQSDQTAIQEAKEELDELEVEQEQDNIQYLIDQITKSQELLDNSEIEEELRGFKAAFDAWRAEVAVDIGKINTESIKSAVDSLRTWFEENKPLEVVQDTVEDMTGNEMEEGKNEGLKEQALNVAQAYQELQEAEDKVYNAPDNSVEKQHAIEAYNEKLGQLNTAISTAKSEGLEAGDFSSVLSESGTSLTPVGQDALADIYSGKTHLDAMDDLTLFKYLIQGAYGNQTDISSSKYTQKYAAMTFTNEPIPLDQYKWFYERKDKSFVLPYGDDSNPYGESWQRMDAIGSDVDSPEDLISFAKTQGDYTVFASMDWGDEFVYYKDGKLYLIRDPDGGDKFSWANGTFQNFENEITDDLKAGYNLAGHIDSNASGTKSFHGGLSYINEAGLEGIITPQGTLTALPSKTGIVPADLTSNLYHLAEVAPNLIKTLDSASIHYPESGSTTNTTDNSTNVQNLYASFQATENFDFDKFLVDVRGVINNTRHTA